MFLTPKLTKIMLEHIVRYAKDNKKLDSSIWRLIASDITADFYDISDLQVKETFYKEILPSLEINNFGIQERTLKIIKSLGKSSIALSSISDKTSNDMTEATVTSSVKLTNKRRKNKSPSGSPIEKLRKSSVSSSQRSSLDEFKNESSISINDVMEDSSEIITAQLQIPREEHSYTFRRNLQYSVDLNSYGDKFHVPDVFTNVFTIELPNSGYDGLIVSPAKMRQTKEMFLSQSDSELPEELKNHLEEEEAENKDSSAISDFNLLDSDYGEFENPQAEIEKNKEPAKSYFEPVNSEEMSLSQSDFELPDSDYEELENQPEGEAEENKDSSAVSDFDLPDSDYDEFENPQAEIEKNKDTAKSYFEPGNYEEEDIEENDFHNLPFTSTQVISEVMPAQNVSVQQYVCEVQEADSTFADESDIEIASSDYEPDESYREYLHALILKNKNLQSVISK